jgi:hypothetical protein
LYGGPGAVTVTVAARRRTGEGLHGRVVERHREELAAVWPAVRDGTAPPTPSPGRAGSLAEFFRVVRNAAAARGETAGTPPEHAVALLTLALMLRAHSTATPEGLRALVDPTADVDADTTAGAGRMTAEFVTPARDPRTPDAGDPAPHRRRRPESDEGDAILVNSSRGGLIDTAALVAEQREGRFTGVGLDVYEAEAGLFFLDKSLDAVDDDTPARLVTFPNVLVSSHQAYYTEDAVAQIIDATVKNVLDYKAGRRSENVLVPRS